MNIAIIQARMGSSRYPGKVLAKINGKSTLWHVINRVRRCSGIDRIVVATTMNSVDDRIRTACRSYGVEVFRGSEQDVLDRYYQAALSGGAAEGDHIVRITADCPLVDPQLIDRVLESHILTEADYSSNIMPPTFPDGMDVEVLTFRTLETVWTAASLDSEREHVTPFIRNHPDLFRLNSVENGRNLSQYRLTFDEPEDYQLITSIVKHFHRDDFTLEEIITFLEANPEMARINEKYTRNQGYALSLEAEYEQKLADALRDKVILITGGTGSFGNRFVERIFQRFEPRKVIIYSRDEFKQYQMKAKLAEHLDMDRLRFFIGDVRDKDRFHMACRGVDYIVHAAALKQVPVCEYNPFEAVKTNILGAQNIIEVAIERGVRKVVALSTDKAVNPINLYGGTKLVSDKLFIAANAYSGSMETRFSVVRYGNVAGSRGSVIPFFRKMLDQGSETLPITDFRMTRFWITLDEGVELVFKALLESRGGETYISKIPSFKVTDLALAMGGEAVGMDEVGIREGEKLHEVMITREDSKTTYEYDRHYIIYPHFEWWEYKKHFTEGGAPIQEGFEYSSDRNPQWLTVDELKTRTKAIAITY